ncbi:hypothetical protein [Streptomyces murinus]|uniref:hypothetical protein n=1 Tax=Streptomyces murinus TaxID=33900 RepID=UPI0037288D96
MQTITSGGSSTPATGAFTVSGATAPGTTTPSARKAAARSRVRCTPPAPRRHVDARVDEQRPAFRAGGLPRGVPDPGRARRMAALGVGADRHAHGGGAPGDGGRRAAPVEPVAGGRAE